MKGLDELDQRIMSKKKRDRIDWSKEEDSLVSVEYLVGEAVCAGHSLSGVYLTNTKRVALRERLMLQRQQAEVRPAVVAALRRVLIWRERESASLAII